MSGSADPWDRSDESSEYYISISDMMIGLLFLFIILLMYFAFQLRDTTDEIVSGDEARSELLQRLEERLIREGVSAEVDYERGVLRLPNEILFEAGSESPKPEGMEVLDALADALEDELPCHAARPGRDRPDTCRSRARPLDAIFVEGHTDSDPLQSNPRIRDNWELSAVRASNTLKAMLAHQAGLAEFVSEDSGDERSLSLFSIAGYADGRPLRSGSGDEDKAANRRIDLRFVMAPPKPPEPAYVSEGLERALGAAPTVRAGRVIAFDTDGSGEPYLLDGWSEREAWGVWSVGASAAIGLPMDLPAADRGYVIELDFLAYVPEESPQRRVLVQVDGAPPVAWVLQGPTNRYRKTIELPAGAIDRPVMVRFQIENPISPLELDLSGDARKLGVGLISVRVQRNR